MWFRFPSLAAFDGWHREVCQQEGIPHPGRNQQTGEVDAAAQWTVAYVDHVELAPDDVRTNTPGFYAEAEAWGAVPCDHPQIPEVA